MSGPSRCCRNRWPGRNVNPLDSSLSIVAYLALFGGVGFLFVFASLLAGRLVRASDPHPEKLEIYECGEPAIGSSFVQFDLRFYVVALVFIIFDVEVAFLFPWATVVGKAVHLARAGRPAGRGGGAGRVAGTAADAGSRRPVPGTGRPRAGRSAGRGPG